MEGNIQLNIHELPSTQSEVLIRCEGISIFNLKGALISGINLEIKKGQCYALIGDNGSGKTLLAETIAGKRSPARGDLLYKPDAALLEGSRKFDSFTRPSSFIALVYFDGSRVVSKFREMYYQKRFNDDEGFSVPLVSEYIESQIKKESDLEKKLNFSIPTDLFPAALLDLKVNQLSNGETKRMLIYLALLRNPECLILDEPLNGLDVKTRNLVTEMLHTLKKQGLTTLIICRKEELPLFTDQVIVIKNKGIHVSSVVDFKLALKVEPDGDLEAGLEPNLKTVIQDLSRKEASEVLPVNVSKHVNFPAQNSSTLIKMDDITISYGNKKVLENINWEVQAEEKWVLSGPNGSGKSTLLSLINGDHPQAYAQKLWLFGQRRGTGESIWDIKKKIGYMSPEMQMYFPQRQEVIKIVASGLYESMGLYRKWLPVDKIKAEKCLELLGISDLAFTSFFELSNGLKRLVLLARTLIKDPPLLILDEPCQGLDEFNKKRFTNSLDNICNEGSHTLIYVSHYREDIPGCVKLEFSLPEAKVSELS